MMKIIRNYRVRLSLIFTLLFYLSQYISYSRNHFKIQTEQLNSKLSTIYNDTVLTTTKTPTKITSEKIINLEDSEKENSFCKRYNSSLADKTANDFMKKDDSYFKECDNLDGIEFVRVKDVQCDYDKETRMICDHSNSKINNVYSLQLNMKGLIQKTNINEELVKCYAERFDKIFNNPSEVESKTFEFQQFTKEKNYTLYFFTHGYYQVNCSLQNKLVYEDYYYIFPNDMNVLMDEGKNYTKHKSDENIIFLMKKMI